jgi:glycogen synthase
MPMRLLFLTNFYPPFDLGGFEQWCHEIAGTLRVRGHSIKILTSQHGTSKGYPLETDVRRSLYLQADIDRYRPVDFFLKRAGQEKHNATELRSAIQQFSPDLIFIWGMWNLSHNLPRLAEQLMPGRVVYYFAGYWPMEQDIHLEYWQASARHPVAESIKHILRRYVNSKLNKEAYPPELKFQNAKCCSQYVRNELVNSQKLPISTEVLLGGIDPQPFLKNSAYPNFYRSPLRLVYFGSLLPAKGVHTIIEALCILKTKGMGDAVDLTLIGTGRMDYIQEIRNKVEVNGLSTSVHFSGRVSRDKIPAWLTKFDIFVFPSIWAEPMARTVMEAMAAGLLVIASRVGGQVEMLKDNYNSLTFEATNAEDLACKIMQVLETPSKYDQLIMNARHMILESFTLERMAADIEAWLLNTMDQSANQSKF